MTKLSQETTTWFFLLLSAITLFLFWRMIQPFALALVTAGIFAVVFAPMAAWLERLGAGKKISSLCVLFATFFVILLPLVVFGALFVDEASSLIASVSDWSWLKTFSLERHAWFGTLPTAAQTKLLSFDFANAGKEIAAWSFSHVGELFSKSTEFIFHTSIFFVALYYFLANRNRIYTLTLDLSPLKDRVDANMIDRIVHTIRTVMAGAVILAAVQAIFATVGLLIFGVPGAFIWGALVLVAAQVPILGVGLVMIPAIVYLGLGGDWGAAVGLLVWSVVAVGLVDNLLSPIILGARTKMPELLILISILGGLQFFGPIGFILGPTVLAILLVLVELYRSGILENGVMSPEK
jgi:predicted PurR-regulated permease PerM